MCNYYYNFHSDIDHLIISMNSMLIELSQTKYCHWFVIAFFSIQMTSNRTASYWGTRHVIDTVKKINKTKPLSSPFNKQKLYGWTQNVLDWPMLAVTCNHSLKSKIHWRLSIMFQLKSLVKNYLFAQNAKANNQ